MLEAAVDVLAAFLIARNLLKWWAWVPAALTAGALIAVTFALAMASLDLINGAEALRRAIGGVFAHGVFCLICTWGFSRRRAKV